MEKNVAEKKEEYRDMEGYIVNRVVGKNLTEKMPKNSLVTFFNF